MSRKIKPKWIKFIRSGFQDKKTKRWAVCTEKDGAIGWIHWFGAWHKYCFFPDDYTIYEQDCLRCIANFIEDETKKQYQELKICKVKEV